MANRGEQELRRLSVELRFLEQTADAIQSRLNMINAVTSDLTYSSMALEGLEQEKENSELLVPIGGGSYIRVKLENPDRIIVSMGAGVSVEKAMQEAKEIVKNRLENLEKTRVSLQQQLSKVAENISEDREKLDDLVGELREGKTPRNV